MNKKDFKDLLNSIKQMIKMHKKRKLNSPWDKEWDELLKGVKINEKENFKK